MHVSTPHFKLRRVHLLSIKKPLLFVEIILECFSLLQGHRIVFALLQKAMKQKSNLDNLYTKTFWEVIQVFCCVCTIRDELTVLQALKILMLLLSFLIEQPGQNTKLC